MCAQTRWAYWVPLAWLWGSMIFPPVVADELQGVRLFTSAAERQRLDLARRQSQTVPKPVEKPVAASTSPSVPRPQRRRPSAPRPSMSVQGLVQRESGRPSTVWLNGQAQTVDSAASRGQMLIRRDGQAVLLPQGGRRVSVEPGQTLQSGQVREQMPGVVKQTHGAP